MQGQHKTAPIKTSSIIATLFIGWLFGMGTWGLGTWGISTWYLNTNHQTGEATPGDVPHLALRQSRVMSDIKAGETAMTTEGIAPTIILPSGPGNTPRRSTMSPTDAHTQTEVPAPIPVYEAESAGLYGSAYASTYANESPLDNGQVQDTGEFIDADDPAAYATYLNAQPTDETVQNTGEFLDVENPQQYVYNDSLYQNFLPQNTGEYIDVDDPQGYVNNFNEQSNGYNGIVQDTGEFIAVEPLP
ncbi:MAG: hypothetical protein COB30_000470 [Ectothiorhodospiraceae bacterium]|nr:hypothetical protein [Ectothiorhodospiraceae bacterium]